MPTAWQAAAFVPSAEPGVEDDPDLYSGDEMDMDLPDQARAGTPAAAADARQQQQAAAPAAQPCATVLEQAEQQEEGMEDVEDPVAEAPRGERSSKRRRQGAQRTNRK